MDTSRGTERRGGSNATSVSNGRSVSATQDQVQTLRNYTEVVFAMTGEENALENTKNLKKIVLILQMEAQTERRHLFLGHQKLAPGVRQRLFPNVGPTLLDHLQRALLRALHLHCRWTENMSLSLCYTNENQCLACPDPTRSIAA